MPNPNLSFDRPYSKHGNTLIPQCRDKNSADCAQTPGCQYLKQACIPKIRETLANQYANFNTFSLSRLCSAYK